MPPMFEGRPLSEEQQRLVEANEKLVFAVACRNFRHSKLPLEDRIQAGMLGLIRGIQGFDPSRDVALSTYAFQWIRNAIQRAEIGHDVVSVPQWVRHSHSDETEQAKSERLHGKRDNALSVVGYDDSFVGREPSGASLDDKDEIEWLMGKIEELSPKLRDVILSLYLRGETRQSIAARYKVARTVVREWHGMAIRSLRSLCGADYAKGA